MPRVWCNSNLNYATKPYIIKKQADQVCTSIIVAAELRYGVEKKGHAALTERVEQLLAVLPILALDQDADRYYGRLRADLERHGQLIGANDMLIAAQALSLDAVLITDNVREFQRVARLRIENWLV